jgi:tetratricopeptide (TPR) repeat protein
MLCGFALLFSLLQTGSTAALHSFDPRQVETEIKQGELDRASATLEDALKRDSRNFEAHLLLGIVRQEQKQPENALQQFALAHDIRPSDPAPYINTGKVLVANGDMTGAATQFSNAIRVDPQSATAHGDLGMLYYAQKRWLPAASELQIAATMQPSNKTNWLALFKAALAGGKFSLARTAVGHIEELSGPSEKAPANLGALQAAAGDYEGAIPNLQKGLAQDPSSSEVAFNLALAWLRTGKPEAAVPVLESLRRTDPGAEVEDLLGDAYEKEGRPVDAVRAYQLAARLDPRNEDYTFDYISELLTHKSYDAAILVSRAAIAEFPDSLKLEAALAGALYGKGANTEAHAMLVSLSDRFPDNILPLFLRGMIYQVDAQPDETLIPQTRAYLATHLEDSVGWLTLGRAQGRQARSDAIASLSRSLALKENSPEAHLEIGKVYFDRADWKSAAIHCKRAVELDPKLSVAWYRLAQASYHLGNKSAGDAAMHSFQALSKTDSRQSAITTFLYKPQ